MRLIITDVTYMYGGRFCVAGWDPENERMVRPLSGPQSHWDISATTPKRFTTGNVVEIFPKDQNATRSFPHKTEDEVVLKKLRYEATVEGQELIDFLEGSVSDSIPEIFSGQLKKLKTSWYVDSGSLCVSLGAVNKQIADVELFETEWDGKYTLKCRVRENNRSFTFTVSSKVLRDIWRRDGLDGLAAYRGDSTGAHVRIGLAGAWSPPNSGDPERCFAMVNNIIFY